MIIPAEADHLEAINAIYNQAVADGMRTAHTEPLSLKQRKKWFEKHNSDQYPVFVYLQEQQVFGWISILPYRSGRQALDEVIEVSYYVDYNKHDQGVGTNLMDHAVSFCNEAGYRLMVAILIDHNSASLQLLDKFGFQEGGRIPDAIHYQNTFKDHLYYYKKL